MITPSVLTAVSASASQTFSRLVMVKPPGALDYELWRLVYLMHKEHKTRAEAAMIFPKPLRVTLASFGPVELRLAVFPEGDELLPLNGRHIWADFDGSLAVVSDRGGDEFVLIGTVPAPAP